jgi:cyanophycinase
VRADAQLEAETVNPHKLLLLLGGSQAFEVAAEEFVPAAGGTEASIALLLQGGAGSRRHLPDYTDPWTRRGVTRCQAVMPGEDGELSLPTAKNIISHATGIFIGGGHTPTYHRLYALEPIRALIRNRYQEGVPVAGVSAGALIAPDICAIPPEKTGNGSVRILPGLGLVSGLVVGVHFTESGALPTILEAMVRTRTQDGWGIDGSACAVFNDGRYSQTLGGNVYQITVTDFRTGAHNATSRVGVK